MPAAVHPDSSRTGEHLLIWQSDESEKSWGVRDGVVRERCNLAPMERGRAAAVTDRLDSGRITMIE
jgi:hypothetical protein